MTYEESMENEPMNENDIQDLMTRIRSILTDSTTNGEMWAKYREFVKLCEELEKLKALQQRWVRR